MPGSQSVAEPRRPQSSEQQPARDLQKPCCTNCRKGDDTAIGDLTYAYDRASRRTRMGGSLARTTLPPAVASATYDANNRLTNWAGLTLDDDDNGNLIREGTSTYTWNVRNQLATSSVGAASFGYDAAGRRRSRTVSGTSLQTLYDGWNAIQLKQAGAAVESRLFGLGLDEIYGRSVSGTSQSYLTDALGSVIELANPNQSAQADYTYGAYGQTTETPAGASSNLIKYTGREQDTAGLYYYRNRYYSTTTSRFISEDPIGLAGGDNLYSYVGGNPIQGKDPLGLDVIMDNANRAAGLSPDQRSPNGNLAPGTRPQDWICSSPAGILNGFGCTKQCCIEHDECFAKHYCNESSWGGSLSSECQACNRRVLWCILIAGPKQGCLPGCSTTFNGAP